MFTINQLRTIRLNMYDKIYLGGKDFTEIYYLDAYL
jgi:hypothetical protein